MNVIPSIQVAQAKVQQRRLKEGSQRRFACDYEKKMPNISVFNCISVPLSWYHGRIFKIAKKIRKIREQFLIFA